MRSSIRFPRRLWAWLLFLVAFTATSFAGRSEDRTQVGHNISIGPGEEVSDATCFGCSIRVRGHVSSDVTALGGSIVIEDQGQIGGDATALGGGIRLDRGVTVHGDVTAIGGRLRRDPAATIGGDVSNLAGPGWIALIVLIALLPFVLFGLFVALIVWLIRRLLRPAAPIVAQPMH
jgi:hypothetical protein